jgi:hypothetical protein
MLALRVVVVLPVQVGHLHLLRLSLLRLLHLRLAGLLSGLHFSQAVYLLLHLHRVAQAELARLKRDGCVESGHGVPQRLKS